MLLRPCDHCQRHVHVDDARCPFCDATLSAASVRYAGRLPRMTRSALFALGAVLSANCGSEVTVYDDDPNDTSGSGTTTRTTTSSSSGNVGGMGGDINVDLYGAPGGFDPQGGGGEGGAGGEMGKPVYGAAPPP